MKVVDCIILGYSMNALGIGKKLNEEKISFLIIDLNENNINDYVRIGKILDKQWSSGFEFLSYFNTNIFQLYNNIISTQEGIFVDKEGDDFIIKNGNEFVKSTKLIFSPAGISPPIINGNHYIGSNSVIDSYYYKNQNVAIVGSKHAFFEQLYAANKHNNNVTVINYTDTFYPSPLYENISSEELSKATAIYKNAVVGNFIIEEEFITIELNIINERVKLKFNTIYNGLDLIYKNVEELLLDKSIKRGIILAGIASGVEYYEYEKLFNEGYILGESLFKAI